MDHCNGFYFPEADAPPELMFILHPIKTIFANPRGGGCLSSRRAGGSGGGHATEEERGIEL
jgi:hypothetical protein